MSKSLCRILSVLICFVFVTSVTFAEPLKEGRIVIKGTVPPGMKVIKKLKKSGLTVVEVQRGKERKRAKEFRNKGYKAYPDLQAHAMGRVGDSLKEDSAEMRTMAVPYDPYYGYQWHFDMIQAEQAWDINAGSGVIVAVLDTGLATGGADGINCVVDGWNTIDDNNNPWDGEGHGTHVSGTIAQSTNNGIGVAGMAHDACIMPVKVLADDGYGPFSDITEGIYWAVDNGAQVINMSLGTNAYEGITSDSVMDPAFDYAYAHGVTVICAAGNDGSPYNVSYPAINPTTISVGAIGMGFYRMDYTNEGTGLDFLAPGGSYDDIDYNGYIDGVLQETLVNGIWSYYFFVGTSMACPHVAGIAAMLISNGTASTPTSIMETLQDSAMDLVDPGWDSISGYGLVQAYDALMSAPVCNDNDNDGVTDCDGDCDDNDPSVHPGASEICFNNIDDNCNGSVDEGCACTDNDGDGWCIENGDCNDNRRLRGVYFNPGVDDINKPSWMNGADLNCNGIVDG